MDPKEFPASFAAFAGPDRLTQFVRFLNREGRWLGRFLFRQEELLERFAARASCSELVFEQSEPLLRMCELHEADLVPDPEGLSARCRGAVTDYTRVADDRFPNTDRGPLVMGEPFENYRYGLWCCPVFRASGAEWGSW